MLQRGASAFSRYSLRFRTTATPLRTMSTVADLNARIADQGSVVRKLKEGKAPAEDVQKEVLTLKELKAELAKLTGVDDKKASGGAGGKKAVKFTLKTPKVRWIQTRER
jgi:hypothetical protein